MRPIRFLAFALVALLNTHLVPAAEAQEAPVFDDSTSVVVVEVPVNVIKNGAPVRGLTAENFQVFDGRRERQLIDFEVVDLKRLQSDEGRPQVPISARRHFLFLLDLSFSQAENLLRATESARGLLSTALHPTDLVAVGVYGKRTRAGMLLNFTSDHSQVEEVLNTLENVFSGEQPEDRKGRRNADPLGLVAGPYSSLVTDIGRAAGSQTTLAGEWLEEGNLHPDIADVLSDMDELTGARQREGSRSDVTNLSRSLSALAQQTRAIDGRKYMVYFSEGFSSDLLFEEGGARTLRDLDKMVKEMQRAGWVLQTVNTARSGESLLDDADGLLMIARETGGDFYTNFNRLDDAMEQMLDSTSVTYLLVVQADDVKMDGSFHELKVKLKDAPRGARVRHREGYYAPNPSEEGPQGLSEQLRLAELVLAGEEGGALPADVAVASFSRPEESLITTWIEIDGPSLLLGHNGEQLDLEIYGYALTQEGEIRDFFSQRMSLELGEHREALKKSGVRFYGDFALPVDEYDLRFLVRRAADGRYGLRTATAIVTSPNTDAPRLLPPFFLSDGEKVPWLVAGESSSSDADYPFIVGERRFVPAVRPVVSQQIPARICVMGYQLDHPSLSLQAQLTTAEGNAVEPGALGLVGKNEGVDGAPTQLFLNLDASSLAPGEYKMTISVQNPDSGAADETVMDFRVEA